MLNQLQNIRSFVERHLGELSSWNDAQVDGTANGDFASAVIPVKGKSYRLAVTSAYIEPPMGKITLTDLQTGHEINGARADAVWDEMGRYVRARLGDEPAEIVTRVLDGSVTIKPIETSPDGREPYLGQGVKFITERNEFIGGMDELAAIVTKVLSPTKVSLTVFPMTGEVIWRNDVMRRSAERQHYCWDFSDPKPKLEYSEHPTRWLTRMYEPQDSELHIMNSESAAKEESQWTPEEVANFNPDRPPMVHNVPGSHEQLPLTNNTGTADGVSESVTFEPPPLPIKRKRGRPFGSKNKPKQTDNENAA